MICANIVQRGLLDWGNSKTTGPRQQWNCQVVAVGNQIEVDVTIEKRQKLEVHLCCCRLLAKLQEALGVVEAMIQKRVELQNVLDWNPVKLDFLKKG